MDQFRQVGEVLGGLKALMVLKHEIQINQRQCYLLFDMLTLAFETISEEIRQNLRLEERNTVWKALELPLKELHRVFKEAELYIRQCMDIKDWWGKAISLHMNMDCIELHIHNLLCCFPVVIEAIETAAEMSGADQEDMHKRRIALQQKYDQECELTLFLWKFGKQYLVPKEICSRLDTARAEDKWLLIKKVEEKKMAAAAKSAKHEQRLGDLLLRRQSDAEKSKGKLMPSNILVGAQDYHVKRRLGSGYAAGGGHLKEIHWLGENFALRTFYGDIGPLLSEISSVLSLSHPNVLQYLCAFHDEDRKEGYLVMELMGKDLGSYIKDNCGQKNRIPFSIPVAVDIMLQIARGMEYLHSKNVYHGDLNPSNILLKARHSSIGGFQAKITGFGLTSIKSYAARSPRTTEVDLDIWLAPEVLAELEQPGGKCTAKYAAKADVYSFGMLCFELLTGKVPFEDGHLQGEKMARNIRAGERPLFSYPSPKYLANLTKKCWQTNPHLRPSFSSICRILRYIKNVLVINPDHGHPDSPPPLVDYCDMEARYLKRFPGEGSGDLAPVSQIPFQMFTYKMVEKEKISGKKWDLANEGSVNLPGSVFDEEQLADMDDLFLVPCDQRSVCSEIIDSKNPSIAMDLRSVISEIPQRKLVPFDQRSFGSESPKNGFSTADQRPVGAETPETKNLCLMDQRSPKIQAPERKTDRKFTCQKLVEVPDKAAIASKVAGCQPFSPRAGSQPSSPRPGCQPASPRPQENSKSTLSKVTQNKSENTEIQEKKQSLRLIVDQKPASEGKISSPATGRQRLPEISENKILQNTESIQRTVSVLSTTCERNSESTANSGNSGSSEKKPKFIRKMKDLKTKTFREIPNESPRSSPARLKITKLISSPGSSPSRTFKTCDYSETPKNDTQVMSSPARMKKTKRIFSPASSPSRAFKMGGRSETPKNDSPFMSSPARMKKTTHSFSPASSPLRTFKSYDYPETPKTDSPARMKKTMPSFSPASSPSRAYTTCASPKHSPACHSKEHSPPMSSPMNPCGRFSRLSRQSSLPVKY